MLRVPKTHKKQFSVKFKTRVAKEAIVARDSGMPMVRIAEKYNTAAVNISAWIRKLEAGEFEVPNSIATARVKKLKTITINGEEYEEYTVPKNTINVNGIDYVKRV